MWNAISLVQELNSYPYPVTITITPYPVTITITPRAPPLIISIWCLLKSIKTEALSKRQFSNECVVGILLSLSACMLPSLYWKVTNENFLANRKVNKSKRKCPWCNGYRRMKWTQQHEFKSWTRLIAFHIALIPLGKVWIQLFSLQLWVNSRKDWVLQPWCGN